MAATDDQKKKEPTAIWTDVNKRVLIHTLATHSGGRYNNLLNDKKKWVLVVKDFHDATGESH